MGQILIFLVSWFFLAEAAQDTPSAEAKTEPPVAESLLNTENSTSVGISRAVKEICEEFKFRIERNRCKTLPPGLVLEMETALDILKNPKEENLKDLSPRGLEVLSVVSIPNVEMAIDSMNLIEKRLIAAHLAERPELMDLILYEDETAGEYRFLRTFFDYHRGRLNDRSLRLFIESVVEWELTPNTGGNDYAYEWLHGFFEKACAASADLSLCVLTNFYCRPPLTPAAEDNLLDQENFVNVLDDVLKNSRPATAPMWWEENMEASDLDSFQAKPHNVCAVLRRDSCDFKGASYPEGFIYEDYVCSSGQWLINDFD